MPRGRKMRSKERAKSLGEVFTPQFLVERILNHIPSDVLLDCTKTVLDNSCGDGQFLVQVAEMRRMHGVSHKDALLTIYGVDIDELNVRQCRERLLVGSKDSDLVDIVHRNIVCADALDYFHEGWDEVGYMWDENDIIEIRKKRREEKRREEERLRMEREKLTRKKSQKKQLRKNFSKFFKE